MTNSYYASVGMKEAVGRLWFNRLSAPQEERLTKQIQTAGRMVLKSRYWGEPQWPFALRNRTWVKLMELGVEC